LFCCRLQIFVRTGTHRAALPATDLTQDGTLYEATMRAGAGTGAGASCWLDKLLPVDRWDAAAQTTPGHRVWLDEGRATKPGDDLRDFAAAAGVGRSGSGSAG
jgi:hypothetical protein